MSNPDSPKHGLQKRKTVTQEKKIAEDEFMAAAIGDVEWLRQSLRGQKGLVNFDRNGLAPIHLAAIHGRVDCLKLLIEKFRMDVNTASATGWRPVHLCISNQTGKRAYHSLHYLLDRGADPSVPNDDGITPMHQAASEGHVQCLKALIEAGGKVWEKDDRGHTPIDLAKLWGHRKCARILATENWHQSKQFLAKELNQLQKIKMQQVLEEMEKDEQLQHDQAFYGDMAFNEWLTSRGLPQQQSSSQQAPPQTNKNNEAKTAKAASKKEAVVKEGTYKPNSLRRPAGKKAPSPIKEEPPATPPQFTARRNTFVSPQHDEHGSPLPPPAAQSASLQQPPDPPARWYNPDLWNNSPKVVGKPYEPLLPDHYPHDEYTMMPKHPPRRGDFSKAPAYASKHAKGATSKLRMPQLPADVIDKKLHPHKYERPVVFKSKHIADVHKREMYPLERLPKQEVGIHLMDDMGSFLFRRGLIDHSASVPAALQLPSHKSSRESEKLAQAIQRMAKPNNYPRITGEEYKIPRTAAV